MSWLDIFKHLLPRGRAWRLTAEKALRSFFEGLTGLPASARAFIDSVYQDLFPADTRELDAWENQFALPDSDLTEQERRDRLAARWQALGGQSPKYIQDTLQAAGFNVFVHEWWEPIPGRSGGTIVDPSALFPLTFPITFPEDTIEPVARDPFLYLWDGSTDRQFVGSGHDLAYCGGDNCFSNSQLDPPGYPLVNKIQEVYETAVGAGHEAAYCGGSSAASGATVLSSTLKQYVIPADSTKYPYFLYIGGETFPDLATVPLSRKDEFEELCLKICPTEQWLGILVDYT